METTASQIKNSKPSYGRQLVTPASLPAEKSVLGAMIADESFVAPIVASGLRKEHFVIEDHRRVFDAVQWLSVHRLPVDFVSVAERLGNSDRDCALLADLTYGVVLNKSHILHHAAIVQKKARLRTLLRISEWIPKTVAETTDPDLVTSELRRMLDACSAGEAT